MSIIERAAQRLAEKRSKDKSAPRPPEEDRLDDAALDLPEENAQREMHAEDAYAEVSPMSSPPAPDASPKRPSAPGDSPFEPPAREEATVTDVDKPDSPFSAQREQDAAVAPPVKAPQTEDTSTPVDDHPFAKWQSKNEQREQQAEPQPAPWQADDIEAEPQRREEPEPPAQPWETPEADDEDDNFIHVTKIEPNLLLSPEGGKTRTAEEFRIIKRPLLVKAFGEEGPRDKHSNLIMVTSSVQSEGKTFISVNLAISIAMELDSTVLLVDADVARPGLSKLLRIYKRQGLIETLTDDEDSLARHLMRTDIPKLTVLPAGGRHKRSTELLASIRMRNLLEEMASRYSDRIVLFDSPPLLESTEAFVLASQMGQVVLVVESESTSQMLVKESLSHFTSTENVSIVLNKCKDNMFSSLMSGKYSGYGYGYGYGEEP